MKLRNFILAAGMSALLSVAGLQINAASASEPTYPRVDYSNTVYSIAIVSGFDVAKDAREGYLGVIGAFNGNLDRSGFLYRILGTIGSYEYDSFGTNFDGDYWQGDVMIGYQIVSNGVTVAAYVGVDYQNYDVSPPDPGNPLNGSETGFKVAVDIETDRSRGSGLYAALDGDYSTAFDKYSVLGRLGMNFGKITIGPEGMLLGDVSGDAQRLGGFILFDLPFGASTASTLSLSAGYQFVNNADDPAGRNFGEEGAYGTVKFSIAFGETHTPLK
jgi:Cellulose biosynthesis protein BcsS